MTEPPPNAARKWLLAACAVWTIIVLATLIRGVALFGNPKHVGIYPLFEQTGEAWVNGRPLYSSSAGLQVFRYSPLTAALLAPLSFLPGPLGSALLRILSLSAFLGGLWAWSRAILPTTLNAAQKAALFLFAAPLAFQALGDVQTTGLAVGLMLLGVSAVAGSRPLTGAYCLVLAAMIKAYPIALLLPLVALFPTLLLWRTLVAIGTTLALPFVLQKPSYVWQQYVDWIRFGLNARQDDISNRQLLDVRVLLENLHVNLNPHQYFLLEIVAAAAVGLLIFVARQRRIERRTLFMLTFGLATCWMTVFGPATESQTYIVVAPITAWVFLAVFTGDIPSGYRWVVFPLYALFGITQFALWVPFLTHLGDYGPHSLAGLLLFGVLAALVFRRSPVPALIGEPVPDRIELTATVA